MRNKKAENKINLPEGWRRVRLGEIGKIISGSTPNTSRPDLWNGDIVWVTPDDLSRLRGKHIETSARKISSKGLKNCSARLIHPNSIVISSRAPIGYLAISKNEFTTNQGCKSLSLYQNYNSDFIYYCLHLYTGGMLTLSYGTTFNEISKTGLEKLEIIVPSSLSEQCKIAEILETVDIAIERTDIIIEKYKRIKQGLMQDLLTRGVVANDELGVMNYELRDEKKYKFKDSPLGRIPEEWEVVELREVGKITYGEGLSEIYYEEYGDSNVYGTGGIIAKSNKFLGVGEALVIPRKGTINNKFYVKEDEKFWVIDTAFYLKPNIVAKYPLCHMTPGS